MRSLLIIFSISLMSFSTMAQAPPPLPAGSTVNDTLIVLWTSGDIEVAEKVCFMYTYNAKKWGWFDNIVFIVWGPSAKLLAENEELQKGVKKMIDVGIKVEACVACASMYGVEEDLKTLGIDVKGMGTVLTKYLKSGHPQITF